MIRETFLRTTSRSLPLSQLTVEQSAGEEDDCQAIVLGAARMKIRNLIVSISRTKSDDDDDDFRSSLSTKAARVK